MAFPRTPSFDLTGKRALVAGASSGIGLASAVALAENGAEVTLVARRAAMLDDLVRDMTREGWSANALVLDVSDVSATARVVAENGPFDVLLNFFIITNLFFSTKIFILTTIFSEHVIHL